MIRMMRRLVPGTFLLLAALPAGAAGQALPRLPERGSPERMAVLDAVRPEVERRVEARVVFADAHVAVLDGWAYVRAIPYAHPESREEYRSDLRIPCESCDPFVFALLRDEGAGWRVVETQLGAEPGTESRVGRSATAGPPPALFRRDPDELALEAAMREYIDALAARDGRRWLALFPRTGPVRVVDQIEDPAHVTQATAAELADDFRRRGGWYLAFFGDVDPVTGAREFDYYAEGFDDRIMWRREARGLYVEPHNALEHGIRHARYVRWKREGGRWVVEEIGVLWS